MSESHVELAHRLIQFWNRGDRDLAMLARYLDPAIELESPFSSLAGEPYRGYAGIEQWIRDVDEQFSQWSIGVDDLRPVANGVIALATINARGRTSDATLQFPAACVFDFGPDGVVARLRIHLDLAEVQEIVGRPADGLQ